MNSKKTGEEPVVIEREREREKREKNNYCISASFQNSSYMNFRL